MPASDRGVRSLWLGLIVWVVSASVAWGQPVPDIPVVPTPSPQAAVEPIPVPPPTTPTEPLPVPGTGLTPPPPASPPLPPPGSGTPSLIVDSALGARPLPGSIANTFPTEMEARGLFRTYTWADSQLTALPPTLLWEPPLAVHRDPRMRAIMTNQPNFRSNNSLETSIGGTIGLFRYEPAGHAIKYQVDIFGVVQTRLSPEDVTVADYRFGLPFTFEWDRWHGKIGYEHTSSHIGDRLIRATGAPVFSHAKDEVALGLGNWVTDRLRLYGNMAYAFFDLNPDRRTGPFRGDVGFDWYDRRPTGFAGTPFVSGNVEFRQDQDWNPNITAQAGWMWRNPYQRFGNFRVFAEYYQGRSPYGQFYNLSESYYGFGIAFDY